MSRLYCSRCCVVRFAVTSSAVGVVEVVGTTGVSCTAVPDCETAGVTDVVPTAGVTTAAPLNDEEKVTACTLAKAAGADFVKTSTGFGPGGATVDDVALMRRVVGEEMGVKAAGGVRDLAALQAMVAAGATRVGASAGIKIVQQSKGERKSEAVRAGY